MTPPFHWTPTKKSLLGKSVQAVDTLIVWEKSIDTVSSPF